MGWASCSRARHVDLDEPVAIKILSASGAASESATARFVREGKAAARIRSDHAVKVRDVGRIEDGTPFMVMELLAGEDLGAIAERGPIAIATAVDWVLQACDALAEAHARGVVHRDLKPSNLFLTHRRDGAPLVKVLDFGISKVQDDADVRRTSTRDVFGSPLYMSPEQLHSTADVDARTDVWSLAAVLFELLAGQAAFLADSLALVHIAILQGPTPDLMKLRPDAPPPLADALARALAKKRDERTPSIAAFAEEIVPFASDVGRAAHAALGAARIEGPPSTPSWTGAASQPQLPQPLPQGVFADTQGAFSTGARGRGALSRAATVALVSFFGTLLLTGVGLAVWSTRARTNAPATAIDRGDDAPPAVVAASAIEAPSAEPPPPDAGTEAVSAPPSASAPPSTSPPEPPPPGPRPKPAVAPPTPPGPKPKPAVTLPDDRL
ncbi:MAG: serine/threonine protein kinase [Labilithrix sp.]|nr:serine/threonine protein kinase [Labilithrix sp.]MCW5809651.1 serine/threonine protein kinase [Labilithrix sp.]